MEKFGIFELLDTLSALVLPDAPTAPPEPGKPKRDDAAFAPPVYGSGAPPEAPSSSATALSSFLEKHEKTVKKLDGGK